MAEKSEKSRFEQIVEILVRHGVEFIVIGGQAETLFGSPRVTYDVDLCYRRSPANLNRLATALREIQPTLRGAPTDLPFRIDAQSLALGSNFTFDTPYGALDLLGWVEPLGDFDALANRAATLPLGPYDIMVISLDDLITVKQHIQRPKDRDSLFQLLAIRRIRDESKNPPKNE
ncbi:MAG: hypothetical protein JNG88_05505 [Phycisphaerales bacterium]|nr:hypothetical protein [Phycisphaerales bacterium]